MIIDAKDLIVGRMATQVAKKALEGEQVDIINCEQAVITGKKADIVAKNVLRQTYGHHQRGPFFPKEPDHFLRRSIRGMLPWKLSKGRLAFGRVKCHVGVPSQFKEHKHETIKNAHISTSNAKEYMTVGQVCRLLGAQKVK